MVLSSASISTTSADAKPVDTSAGSGTTSSADAELEVPYLPSEQAAGYLLSSVISLGKVFWEL